MTVKQIVFKIEYLQDLINRNNREIENLKLENSSFINKQIDLNQQRKQTLKKQK